jgi:hypothetical protein
MTKIDIDRQYNDQNNTSQKDKQSKRTQIGKDDDKKESEYQKYIYYASKGYQYYGESGQDTNTKLF